MIDFVEKKFVDYDEIKALNTISSMWGQWSNFGPASTLLESWIEQKLHLGNYKVVATSSGTAAIHALILLKQHLIGKKLRWAVPSFTFASLRQGPLSEAIIFDVGDEGLIALEELQERASEFDGLVVCDYMGTMKSTKEYNEFSKKYDKKIVFDCATSFDRSRDCLVSEAISFHHTKPWGFGEGGCLVVPPEELSTARMIVNCGLRRKENNPQGSGDNYKMSDVAASYILSWLNSFNHRKDEYRANYDRIRKIIEKKGLQIMGSQNATPGNLPILMDNPTFREVISITLGKYYKPLGDTPKATYLWERIVNFPCHPGVNLTDEQIERIANELLDS
jgi:dTDP-4-amino-4,6-dideoxygalactose transaminase